MGFLLALDHLREVRLDDGTGVAAIGGFRELHTDAGASVALGTGRRDPNDLARDGQPFFKVHEVEQQEHLVAEVEALGALHEQATALNEGHVSAVQGLPVLDRQ